MIFSVWLGIVNEIREIDWFDVYIMNEYWSKGLTPQEAVDKLYF